MFTRKRHRFEKTSSLEIEDSEEEREQFSMTKGDEITTNVTCETALTLTSASESASTISYQNNPSQHFYAHNCSVIRPILVGYAFGPKKMKTMSLIMAEASMEVSTVQILSPGQEEEEEEEVTAALDETKKYDRIRVSFVPLDLDIPFEEQHGGHQFDAILHKLTEDIITTSKISKKGGGDAPSSELKAMERVNRLTNYKNNNNPYCALVDHPRDIFSVMCRHDISNILTSCLKHTKTTSGLRVSTPNYLVFSNFKQDIQIPFQFPIIVKPLQAAGTAESHQMQILFSEEALNQLRPPVLLQQYANHDAILYKVYVLGDQLWVFSRKSLPNLKKTQSTLSNQKNYVEFDSQKQPYPDLKEFAAEISDNNYVKSNCTAKRKIQMTVEEIKPVVQKLRQAFGLDLFGFDVLVCCDSSHEHQEEGTIIQVVDVNYFPSYKEVENFPRHLARYLVKKALETRKD